MARARHARTAMVSGIAAVIVVGAALVAGVPAGAAVAPSPVVPTRAPDPTPSGTASVGKAPQPIGLPLVVPPAGPAPRALPRKSGTVRLNRNLHITPGGMRTSGPVRGSGSASASATALTPTTAKVALRALVIAVDDLDIGLPTWKTTLDRVGAPYDVLLSRTTPLTATSLVRPDGVGRYDAILLTSASQLYQDNGNYVSGLDGTEWNTLWAYERDYAVRQAVLYGSYGAWPEDYCLQGVSEGAVGDTPVPAALTTTGASIFDYLKSTAQIPITQSYLYRTSATAGCSASPVLTNGTDVLGVLSPSTDGRERLQLTFSSNQYLLQSDLLVYGLVRWASRGLFLGEQRHYLNVDVDDWFNSTDHRLPDGTFQPDPGFQMTAHDAYNTYLKQTALRTQYPLANTFAYNMAYNGGPANQNAGRTCSPNGGINQLTATSRCLANQFRWINHSLTHPKMNATDYATSFAEINNNLTVASRLGLPVDKTVFKSPEYSGLGVYNPDPNDTVNPPTDFGLAASNANMLAAAKAVGVKYLHGNMSFPSHVPACFDCGIVHPLEPSLTVVPDWPTNIAYFCTTPDEETSFYNSYYGPGGLFPFWPTNRTYDQVIGYETDVALLHLTSGSIYSHTFHIGNVHDYGSGRTLVNDWLTSVLTKYSSYYAVPALNPAWPALAQYTGVRNAHYAAMQAGVDAVFDRLANTVTVTSPAAGSVIVTGARTTGFTTYGSDSSATITLTAGGSVVFTPSLRP